MAKPRSVLDTKYAFEYDVGMFVFGTISVVKERETDSLRTCKTVSKASLRSVQGAVSRLKELRALEHPHIASVMDVMEDQTNLYIISEYCPGGEVSEWLTRLDEGYWLQEQTCVAYVRQALLALCHSHAKGVFHRDLNPSTMYLTSKMPDAQVKVMDLGLAAVLDPDNSIMRRKPSPFSAPEVVACSDSHPGVANFDGSVDMWSIGAIAHTLLTGRSPPNNGRTRSVGAPWLSRNDESECWADRSSFARDFTQKLLSLSPLDRLTPAKALQHPWLKGMQALTSFPGQNKESSELRNKTLCYMLSVLLVPVLVPYKDFEQLRRSFRRGDSDDDGIISREVARRLLLGRCSYPEAVDAALNIVDIEASEVVDLCATACADLIAREFFGSGPSSQPLVGPFKAADLAPRMVKRFSEVCGDKRQPVVSAVSLRARLRTATARDIETYAGVRYEDILGEIEDGEGIIHLSTLEDKLAASQGCGTPLGVCEESIVVRGDTCSTWSGPFDFINFFQQCRVGSHQREESPNSFRVPCEEVLAR